LAKNLTIDEFRLTILVPHDLPERKCRAIRALLFAPRLRAELLHAIRKVFRRHLALTNTALKLSR
jgi:hypothetical protein